MGVVRREGDWRLEKTAEGVYEVTFQKETQMRIYTADAPSHVRNRPMLDTVPVREVGSYTEAEGLFEEKAHGPPPFGLGYSVGEAPTNAGTANDGLQGEEFGLSNLPPLGISLVFLVAGGFSIYLFRDAGNTIALLFGLGLVGISLVPIAYAWYLFKTEDWQTSWEFLITVEEESESSTSASDETETTPPASEKLKNTLIFDRAEQQCEWCDTHFDHPEVHHIEPRSEGGPNEPTNLIVLCPNCHEKADRESIPRSKLKAKAKRLPKVSLDRV